MCFYHFEAGMIGLACLLLSVRLAHASLQHKLNARSLAKEMEKDIMEGKLEMEKVGDPITEYKPVSQLCIQQYVYL